MHDRFCTDWMRKEEVSAAEDFLKSGYDADRVAGVDLDFSLDAFASSPLYVPAHVFRSQHFGAKMRTFVSGAQHSMTYFPDVERASDTLANCAYAARVEPHHHCYENCEEAAK